MRIAVVGAGVSGLVAAHLLHRQHDVTVFEAGRLRGRPHEHRPRSRPSRARFDVDTGFIVFNDRNYPQLRAAPARASASPRQPSDMCFGVSDGDGDFEYASTSPNGLFAKRAHLAAPAFHRMVADVRALPARGARAAGAPTRTRRCASGSRERDFSEAFVERADRPAGGRGVVGRPAQMWSFPARFLVQFFDNHGMLGLRGPPEVAGGARRLARATSRR